MNKNELNKDDPQIRALALAIATNEAHIFPASAIAYAKELLEMESVSYKELSQHFQGQGIGTDMIGAGVQLLEEQNVIERFEQGSADHFRFSQGMVDLILMFNPDAKSVSTTTKEKKMNNQNKQGNQNKQDASNQGSIQKADTTQGQRQDQNKATRSKFEEQVEKISTKENLELAKKLVGGEQSSMDEEVNLVRAIYDENAQGVNFDTIANKFDVRGERASLFVSLSKDLQNNGVIDKLPGANGDLYVVTMPFRQLMENAKRGDTERYEGGGADVTQARTQGTQELVASGQQERADQDRRDDAGSNERRTGENAEQYKNETGRDLSQDVMEKRNGTTDANRGTATAMQRTDTTAPGNQPSDSQARSTVDTPMSVRDQQRESGNAGRASQGGTASSGGDTGQGNERQAKGSMIDLGDDFKPDPSVLSVSIAVFGQPMPLDEVRTICRSAEDFLQYAERNPDVKPTFEVHGITFGKERAEQFLRNAQYYGLGD